MCLLGPFLCLPLNPCLGVVDRLYRRCRDLCLRDIELADKRAITLDINTFLGLLLAFNKKGIHFSNVTEKSDNLKAMQEDGAMDMTELDDL